MSIEKEWKGLFAKILAYITVVMLFLATNVITAKADPTPNYLTFTAEEAGSTITLNYVSCDGDKWSYSKNGGSWVEKTGSGETITLENAGDTVQLKAKGLKTDENKHFKMTGKLAASGSVTSLTDENGGDENVTLTDSSYVFMFSECDSLTKAPELPATTLTDDCYRGMFRRCTSLTKAPELPATTLTDGCYQAMFLGCTGLTETPELPATTLTDYCYESMFSSCSSLTKAPELPATVLAGSCYSSMFNHCSNLTETPELPATTLANSCYLYMFNACSSLTDVPELPATTLPIYCYANMFSNCTGLQMWYEPKDDVIKEWKIPASSSSQGSLKDMFKGCPGADFCLDPNNTSLDIPVLNKVYYLFKTSPKPTPNPQPTSSTDKDDDDDNKKDRKERKYVDLDTNKSELPYGYVLMLNLEDMKVLQDMKVHPVDSKTNTNQQFLTQMFANQMGKKARILLTKSIHPRNPLTKEQLGIKKYLKWFHLEKKAQPIYAVCYNETDKAYYMSGTLDENGTALLRDFIARDATNITLFVLE